MMKSELYEGIIVDVDMKKHHVKVRVLDYDRSPYNSRRTVDLNLTWGLSMIPLQSDDIGTHVVVSKMNGMNLVLGRIW